PPMALCVSESGLHAPETHILQRGNPHVPTQRVDPGFPEVCGGEDAELPTLDEDWTTLHRRLILANWITVPQNPLTARVMANRVWQYHFGRGLVRSSNNFGLGGDAPTHPELLDWLASELVDAGWHLKHMHRLILTSNTYRLSTDVGPLANAQDPRNDHLSHFDLRRLTAEEMRDSLLAVNGRLNRKMHGQGFYSEIPADILAGQSRPGEGWGKSGAEERARRSIYIHVKRSLLTPILEAFDLAETDNSCPVRFTTTQPTQALGMLNSAYLQQQAQALAERLKHEEPLDIEARIERGLRLALGRAATQAEIARGRRFVEELQGEFQLSSDEALRQWCLLLYNLNEFAYLH
ncbi:MAG TPA: DUF1553 domain-containing protein, partial [Pirellulaceae bacterium]